MTTPRSTGPAPDGAADVVPPSYPVDENGVETPMPDVRYPDRGYQPPPDVYPTPAAPTTPHSGATGTTAATPPARPSDPTAPLQDDSSRLGTTLTGPTPGQSGQSGSTGPFSAPRSDLQNLHNQQPAPESDYAKDFHNYTEDDYKQNQSFGKLPEGVRNMFAGGDISHNDLDRIKFGSEEPNKITGADNAQNQGKQQLGQYSQAINSGDTAAVGKADDILKQAEPALAFFEFFAPAYNDWTGAGVSYATLKHDYEAEYGMSFADYSADAQTMADMSQKLTGMQQTLSNSYNALVPTWQGAAASAFESKMSVFFRAATTVSQDVSVAGKDVAALVHGLQQLVLAKAQTVSEMYAATLPSGIDGVMARTMVKVAKGQADFGTNLIAFYLLSGKPQSVPKFPFFLAGFGGGFPFSPFDPFDPFGSPFQELAEKVAAAQAAPRLAADWCNNVLKPQFETREQALTKVNAETKQRVQAAFQEFTSQLTGIQDPFVGMDKAGTPTTKAPTTGGTPPSTRGPQAPSVPGGGGGGAPSGGGGGGAPSGGGGGGSPTPSVPTMPSPGAGITTPAGVGTPAGPSMPTIPSSVTGTGAGTNTTTGAGTPPVPDLGGLSGATGTTRPAGLPTGAGYLPPGVPIPQGYTEDPTTGAVLPTPPSGLGAGSATGAGGGLGGTTPFDPKHDIHTNKDGSVSLGTDRGLTISPEAGKKGVFTLSDTDSDGLKHTYRVHFDAQGNPVVTEPEPPVSADGVTGLTGLSGLTSPQSDLSGSGLGSGGLGSGGLSGAGLSGAGISGGTAGGLSGLGGAGGGAGAGAGGGMHTGAAASGGDGLQDGAHVGADNAMSASGASGAATGSPVAGASGGSDSGGHQAGGFGGGLPMGGAGRGAGGGGGQEESARKYQQRSDVVGEDDLEEWQRMGPVIGEQ